MAYDPMEFARQKAAITMDAFSNIGKTIAALPELYKNDKMYRDIKEANGALYNEALSGVQAIGVDPSAVPKPIEGETREAYVERMADFASQYIVGPGNKLNEEALVKMGISNQAPIKEASRNQAFLNNYDPMGQIRTDTATASPMQTPITETPWASEGGGTPLISGRQGVEDPFTGKTTPWGASSPLPNEASPVAAPGKDGVFDELAKLTIQSVRSGNMSGEKAFEKMADLELMKGKLKLEEAKEVREAEKRKQERWRDGIVGAVDTNELTDTKGNSLESLTLDNIDTAGIGPRLQTPSGGGRGGSGSGAQDKPFVSWTQYKDVESQLKGLRTGIDPDTKERIPFDAAEYEKKQYEAAQQLFAYNLEVNGKTYPEAQQLAFRVLDTKAVIDEDRTKEIVVDSEGKFTALNLAHPKTMNALVEFAVNGGTARDLLASLKKLKGLNPSRQ